MNMEHMTQVLKHFRQVLLSVKVESCLSVLKPPTPSTQHFSCASDSLYWGASFLWARLPYSKRRRWWSCCQGFWCNAPAAVITTNSNCCCDSSTKPSLSFQPMHTADCCCSFGFLLSFQWPGECLQREEPLPWLREKEPEKHPIQLWTPMYYVLIIKTPKRDP